MSQDIALERDLGLEPAKATMIAFVAVLIAHTVVDALGALLPSSLGLVEARFQLTTKQTAWLMGIGPLCSGLAQPLCALLSDRFATRQLGVWGVVLAVLGIGALGLASDFWSLVLVYAFGVIGIGMYHPVAAATIGHLWHTRRTSAISIFFVAGMLGSGLGAFVWPRFLSTASGFEMLPLVVAPLILLAIALHRSFAYLQPVHVHQQTTVTSSTAVPWTMVAILYVSAVLRFCVNVALIYLFVRWAQSHVAVLHADWSRDAVAKSAAPRVGNLNAAMFVGMAIGGLSAGMLVRPGKEKRPMIWVPVLFSPVIGLFPFLPLEAGYLLAIVAGVGFSAMIPVTIALAQQLMPQRTNLASSLMMGGAWAVSMLGPTFAEMGVARFGLPTTFVATAVTLAIAGLVCVPLATESTSDSNERPSVP
ncbi:MAG: MFS transporter [Bythopirellula sp.]